MNQFELIKSFAKGKVSDNSKQTQRNAVIYTRVSTKEQAETNQSLETQKKYCLQYALKHDLNVLGFFGGTYESAKTDERNEFNRMIRFVKNQKEGVSAILVYSLDRFSRTGVNALKQISFVDRFRALWSTALYNKATSVRKYLRVIQTSTSLVCFIGDHSSHPH